MLHANLSVLSQNPYPGRGIVIGKDRTGKYMIQIYWIMGRSENSRNRVLSLGENGRVFTEAADPTKVKDSSLIIYNAMLENHGEYVVSNGHQTDAIARRDKSLSDTLATFRYEPDAPNFTPRISGACFSAQYTGVNVWLSMLKKSPLDTSCIRLEYLRENLLQGVGYCLTTYSGDGNPLPSFDGEPHVLALDGGIDSVADSYWEALNSENRIGLAVKFIDLVTGISETVIRNKYQKVV
ncbi:MAG: IMP cyclohydrolase [bacterium]